MRAERRGRDLRSNHLTSSLIRGAPADVELDEQADGKSNMGTTKARNAEGLLDHVRGLFS